MALDEHSRPTDQRPSWPSLRDARGRGVHLLIAARDAAAVRLASASGPIERRLRRARALGLKGWRRVEPWLQRQPVWRWATRSLGRRILVANMFGWVILFVGLMVISQANRWLVEAKLESLGVQARTIAAAIASGGRPSGGPVPFDFGDVDPAQVRGGTFTDDTFADIRLALAPERVAPVLARLIPIGDVRARIYGPDGFQIIDSAQRLQRGQISRPPTPTAAGTPSDEALRSFWTRFTALFTRSDLPVYREIGSERGTAYPEIAHALQGQGTSRMLLLNNDGEQMAAVAAPIVYLGAVRGAMLLTSRPGDLDEVLWRQRRALLVLSLIALATSLLAAWMLRQTIAGPMRRLSAAAEHVSRSINAQHELPDFPNRRDEVGAMAASFKDMTASLFRRIEASDKFAQDVAHELKNPVAAARSTAESLSFAKTPAQRDELVRQIQGELKRLNKLITDVAKASRLDAELALQETEAVDLARLVAGVVEVLNSVQRDQGRSVAFAVPTAPGGRFIVDGHEGRLSQVMTNLIDNAASFSPPGGAVRVALTRAGDTVSVTVDDDGPGIPPDRLEHVFKRFYSDRPQSDRTQGKNSGLGLSISREIVQAHGGTIRAENRPAAPGEIVGRDDLPELGERRIPGVAGARFVVDLPAIGTRRRPAA